MSARVSERARLVDMMYHGDLPVSYIQKHMRPLENIGIFEIIPTCVKLVNVSIR